MALKLADLLKPVTQPEAETTLLGILDAVGFPATSWQPKSVPRTFVKAVATLYADLTTLVHDIAAGGFLQYAAEAPEGWLDLCVESQYQEARTSAISTVGKATLTNFYSSPHVIAVGQLWAQDAAGRRFTNTTGGTVAAGSLVPLVASTLELEWKAESPGAAYNLAPSTLTALLTPLPLLSINNPALPGSSTWITTSGADAETNSNLIDRCQKKWATLGTGGASAAYIAWAKGALAAITRVVVDNSNPDGPGTVRVYLATAGGVPSNAEVAIVDAAIQAKRSCTATVSVLAATVVTIAVTATLLVYSAYSTTAPTEAAANVTALQQAADIGATVYTTNVIEALSAPKGVRNITLAAPGSDHVLSAGQVPVFTVSLTVVLV